MYEIIFLDLGLILRKIHIFRPKMKNHVQAEHTDQWISDQSAYFPPANGSVQMRLNTRQSPSVCVSDNSLGFFVIPPKNHRQPLSMA
jgi:hypothetical protein